jgi:uncharacterized membrane protein
MKKALFQPFQLTKWISVGFTAFLAGLTECSSGSGGGTSSQGKISDIGNFNPAELFSFPELARDWLIEHPVWFGLIIIALIAIFLLATVITWISSRGKFMFLYNVVNNSDEVIKPWHDFRKHGNSLFWWQLIYGAIVLVIIILLAIYGFGLAKNFYDGIVPEFSKISFIIAYGVTIFALITLFGYISLFLNDFIVPIMYKQNCSAIHAWSKYFTLLIMNPGSFILYGLLILAMGIAVAIAIVIIAVSTCCIGLTLLIIPFVGSVFLLPVTYTFRAFSIEFLAQFGDEYDVLMETEEFLYN